MFHRAHSSPLDGDCFHVAPSGAAPCIVVENAMTAWLAIVCGIAVVVAATYLLLVILQPHKF